MTDADIFHNNTQPYGGRLNRESLPEHPRQFYAGVATRAEDLINSARRFLPRLPDIHFDFVHNAEVNALAFKSNDRYFIGLTTGALFMLRMVIGRILSDARLFKAIGDPNEESADLIPLREFCLNADEMCERVALAAPKNRIRQAYAQVIQDQAMLFLVGHEIAHITRGHVDYLRSKRNTAFTIELGWSGERSGDEVTERQCFEQDADTRSVVSRVDSLRLTYLHPSYSELPWTPSFDGPGQLIYDWSVSINVLFRLFGDVRFSRWEENKSNYPPLPLRRAMCELAALSLIQTNWDPKLHDIARKGLALGRHHSEHAFAAILGEEVSVEGLRSAFSRNGYDYAVRLEEYFGSKLVEQLRPFSYEELNTVAPGLV